MEERPMVKVQSTAFDKVFEIICWLLIVAIWTLAPKNYANLPDVIPIHYNGAGQADDFGGKATILILPVIATILFIVLTVLNKFPHIFNYPVNITQDNAARQYTYATKFKNISAIFLSYPSCSE